MSLESIDRPHPGPLPQERENNFPRYGDLNNSGNSTRIKMFGRAVATAIPMNDLSASKRTPSLSLGDHVTRSVRLPWGN